MYAYFKLQTIVFGFYFTCPQVTKPMGKFGDLMIKFSGLYGLCRDIFVKLGVQLTEGG